MVHEGKQRGKQRREKRGNGEGLGRGREKEGGENEQRKHLLRSEKWVLREMVFSS